MWQGLQSVHGGGQSASPGLAKWHANGIHRLGVLAVVGFTDVGGEGLVGSLAAHGLQEVLLVDLGACNCAKSLRGTFDGLVCRTLRSGTR